MEVVCPFWNGSWRCRLCMIGSTLQNLWKQSNAKCRKVVRWTKPWRRGPFWRECSSPLIHCLAGAKKESKHCISLEVLGPNWQSQAQSSTQQVSVSVTCRTCVPDKFASYWTHPCKFWELLPRQARDGAHCVSVHTEVQTWASDSYLTLTCCCVCLALWMSSSSIFCLWCASLLDLPPQTTGGCGLFLEFRSSLNFAIEAIWSVVFSFFYQMLLC